LEFEIPLAATDRIGLVNNYSIDFRYLRKFRKPECASQNTVVQLLGVPFPEKELAFEYFSENT
jgi:hypothetical protein